MREEECQVLFFGFIEFFPVALLWISWDLLLLRGVRCDRRRSSNKKDRMALSAGVSPAAHVRFAWQKRRVGGGHQKRHRTVPFFWCVRAYKRYKTEVKLPKRYTLAPLQIPICRSLFVSLYAKSVNVSIVMLAPTAQVMHLPQAAKVMLLPSVAVM